MKRDLSARVAGNREDLHALSFAVGSVLELRTPWVSEVSAEPVNQLHELVVGGTQKIETAIGHLRHREYELVIEVSRALRALQKDAELVHDGALSTLFRKDDDFAANTLLREKATLDELEATLRRCGALGKMLAYLAVKNG